MQKLIGYRPEETLSPDIDFRYVSSPQELICQEYDCVYAWPEQHLAAVINETYTAHLGFNLDTMFSRADCSLNGLYNYEKPSHTYTLALKAPIVIPGFHRIWTSAGKPIIMRRADQKKLDYEYNRDNDLLYITEPSAQPKVLQGSYYLLSDRWTGHNLYHWTYDSVSRLNIYFKLRSHMPNLKLLCIGDHNMQFHKEWIKLLGIEKQVVYVEPQFNYQVDMLLCTPRIGLASPANMGQHLESLVDIAGIKLPADLCGRKNIFINRKPGTVRSLVNGREISKIIKEHGFHEIFLEDYCVASKLAIAQSCRNLVGIYGSGMFLLSFMRKGSSILEITHDRADCPAFFMHSMCMNHNYGFCAGKHVGNEQIDLDPVILKQCLTSMP